jgi:glycosyltransferase involved in cell wall biosynthesis
MSASPGPRNKVLAFTPFFLYPDFPQLWNRDFDPLGGMHLLTHGLTTEVAKRGVNFEVLTMGLPGVPKDHRLNDRVMVRARRLPVLPIRSKLEGYFGLVGAWAKASFLWVLRNRSRLRQEIGLVHAHCDGSASALWLGLAASKVLKVPLVTQIHSSRLLTQHPTTWFEFLSDPFAKYAEYRAVKSSDYVLALTEKNRTGLRDAARVPDGKVLRLASVTSSGFEDKDTVERRAWLQKEFSLPTNRPIVLYLGRIAAEKGVEFFVEAAASIPESRTCQFVICGDGPERPKIEALIAKCNLQNRFTITGFIKHEYVPSMIAMSEFGVVPSRYEELGLVILEFMSMRRSVIVHDVGGAGQLIQSGVNGILVPPFKPELLAREIEHLLDDPALRERLATNAMALPNQKYSLSEAAAKLLEIYQSLGLEVEARGGHAHTLHERGLKVTVAV